MKIHGLRLQKSFVNILILIVVLNDLCNAQVAPLPGLPQLPVDVGGECTEPRVRRAWSKYTEAEKRLYIEALMLMKETHIYDEFTEIHNDDANRFYSHGTSTFLLWHRLYIWEFENALRSLGARFKCMTLPYWSWERDAGREVDSPVFALNYFGTTNGKQRGTNCITDGVFNAWLSSDHTCVKRSYNMQYGFTGEARLMDVIVGNPRFGTNSTGFRVNYESAPHAGPHNFLGADGGHMATMRAPDDPLFWLHHCNVDRHFYIWQDCHDYEKTGPDGSGAFQASRPGYDGIDSTMPYVFMKETHRYFRKYGKMTPRKVYNVGEDELLDYSYDRDDHLVHLINAVGNGTCRFNLFGAVEEARSEKMYKKAQDKKKEEDEDDEDHTGEDEEDEEDEDDEENKEKEKKADSLKPIGTLPPEPAPLKHEDKVDASSVPQAAEAASVPQAAEAEASVVPQASESNSVPQTSESSSVPQADSSESSSAPQPANPNWPGDIIEPTPMGSSFSSFIDSATGGGSSNTTVTEEQDKGEDDEEEKKSPPPAKHKKKKKSHKRKPKHTKKKNPQSQHKQQQKTKQKPQQQQQQPTGVWGQQINQLEQQQQARQGVPRWKRRLLDEQPPQAPQAGVPQAGDLQGIETISAIEQFQGHLPEIPDEIKAKQNGTDHSDDAYGAAGWDPVTGQAVYTDSRVTSAYNHICTIYSEDNISKQFKIHLTAIAECQICHAKKHASIEWMKMTNMLEFAPLFQPICSPNAEDVAAADAILSSSAPEAIPLDTSSSADSGSYGTPQ